MKVERKDEGAFTTIYVWPDDAPEQPWFAHRISIGRFDWSVNSDEFVPPEPSISLLRFNGGLGDLPSYIRSVQRIEQEALNVRVEKHIEYQKWRKEKASV